MYNHGHICEVEIPGRRGAGSSSEKHQEKEAAEILEGQGAWHVWPAGKWLGRAGIVVYEFARGGGKRSRRGEEDSREGEELF